MIDEATETLLNWVGVFIGAVASALAGFILKDRKELKDKVNSSENDVKLLTQKVTSIQNELTEFKEMIREDVSSVKSDTTSIHDNLMKIALSLKIDN